jgi:hypothetical protein
MPSGGFDCPVYISWGGFPRTLPPVNVATDVCGEIPPTIPITLDCSLCGLGWPQDYGRIDFRLYRETSCSGASGIIGDYSYWLNGAYLPGSWPFSCENKGDNQELAPNEWVAGGDFNWGSKWRISSRLTVVNTTSVNVTSTIWRLNPSTMQWSTWVTFSQNMTEINPSGNTDPRRVRFFQSSKISISPNGANGGRGDVKYVKMTLATYPKLYGCGQEICSFWNGQYYLSCFRAEFTDPGSPPRLLQMGKNLNPCGTRDNFSNWYPDCYCDQIVLLPSGQSYTQVNGNPQFITDYGYVGVNDPALNPSYPNDPYGVVQQIQVGGTNLIVKKIGNKPMFVASRLVDTDPYTIVIPTVVQGTSPTIHQAVFGNPAWRIVNLYSLAFPNPEIFPDVCATAIQSVPSQPSNGYYWCVNNVCVNSPVMPAGATSGPFSTGEACAAVCGVVDTRPFWCVNSVCTQAATQPAGSTGGPYATASECNLACEGTVDPWWCSSGDCSQSELPPLGVTGGPYPDQAACVADCGAAQETMPETQQNYQISTEIPNKTEDQKKIIERFKLPCINRGPVIGRSGFT